MPPLGRVVVGFIVVLVDVRFNGLDVIPDVAGWAFVLIGLGPLVGRNGWFQLAAAAAVVELVASCFVLTQAATGLPSLVDAVANPLVVFGVCSGVMATVASPAVRATADAIRWLSVVLGIVDLASRMAVDGQEDVSGLLGLGVVLFVLVALGVMVWFLVFCWRQRTLPELQP